MWRSVNKSLYRLMKLPPQVAYALGLGPVIGRVILLLTTTGRKSGKDRVTPLQYEDIDGAYYIGSARGTKADWYRNIVANNRVYIRVKSRRFDAIAEPVEDPERFADYMAVRLQNHPRFVGRILKSEGFPSTPTREQLLEYAAMRAMVIVHPIPD